MSRKLSKVILEFDNGEKEYIDGDDLKKWQDAIDSAIVLDFTHRGCTQKLLGEITWKKM